jgi:hypothetical protein
MRHAAARMRLLHVIQVMERIMQLAEFCIAREVRPRGGCIWGPICGSFVQCCNVSHIAAPAGW